MFAVLPVTVKFDPPIIIIPPEGFGFDEATPLLFTMLSEITWSEPAIKIPYQSLLVIVFEVKVPFTLAAAPELNVLMPIPLFVIVLSLTTR